MAEFFAVLRKLDRGQLKRTRSVYARYDSSSRVAVSRRPNRDKPYGGGNVKHAALQVRHYEWQTRASSRRHFQAINPRVYQHSDGNRPLLLMTVLIMTESGLDMDYRLS